MVRAGEFCVPTQLIEQNATGGTDGEFNPRGDILPFRERLSRTYPLHDFLLREVQHLRHKKSFFSRGLTCSLSHCSRVRPVDNVTEFVLVNGERVVRG